MSAFRVFIALLIWTSPALADVRILEKDFGSANLGRAHLSMVRDPTAALNIDQVAAADFAGKFQAPDRDKPHVNFTRDAIWIRFTVTNAGPAGTYVLEQHNAINDSVMFCSPSAAGWSCVKAGDQQPFAERYAKYRNFTFALPMAAGETQTFYLRLASQGSMRVDLTVWEPTAFSEAVQKELTVYGIYYGLMLAMALYNAFLYFALRDRSYLYYVAFLGTFILFQAAWDGLSFQYFWPRSAWLANYSLQFFVGLAIMGANQFTRTFLNTRENTPRLDKYLKFGIGLAGLLILSLLFDRGTAVRLTVPAGLVSSTGTFLAAVLVFRKGYKPARYFLLAWISLIVGNLSVDFMEWGLLPHTFFTEFGLRIGTALEVLLLSIALADRINVMRADKEQAQREALETERKALETQRGMTKAFERFVPAEFLDLLQTESVVQVKLGDQIQREMTILFSDIRDFTTMSEKMSPKENFDFINFYLEKVGPKIRNHCGFIDKYIGDAVMALFPEKPEDGVKAAIAVARCRDEYNAERLVKGLEPIGIGVGVHTGKVMLGVIGEHERMEGTVISDVVNAASRIEGLSKQFGASVIISEETYALLPNPHAYNIRYLGWAVVKGKDRKVSLFEVCDGDIPAIMALKMKSRIVFENAVVAYFAEDYDLAVSGFQQVLAGHAGDKAAAYYLALSQDELKV